MSDFARPNVAPPLGPILGGVISARLGWNWIFWFLVILSGAALAILFIFLPETARNIVDDGTTGATGIHRSHFHPLLPRLQANAAEHAGLRVSKVQLPNPLRSLAILAAKDSFIVIVCNGLTYMTYCCVQATLSTLFVRLYGFRDLEAGLIYIPFGVGCFLSSWLSGTSVRSFPLDFSISP